MSWALAENGAKVWLNGRNKEKLNILKNKILSAGYKADVAAFDITDELEVNSFFNNLPGQKLHVLINNAYAGTGGGTLSATPKDFSLSYDVTVTSAFVCFKAALPLFIAAQNAGEGTSVINVGSMYGSVSPDLRIYGDGVVANPPFYGAAKAGLAQLTRYVACEYAKKGIRANTISPGPFPSSSVKKELPEFVDKLCEKSPMGRVGQRDEIKGAVTFLASDASSYVTGINLPVDGGWTAL